MGIGTLLKSLFKGPAPEETKGLSEKIEEDLQESVQASHPAFDPEMPVDVMENYSTVLLSGKLAGTGYESLTIERIAGKMSFTILKPGTSVLVRGYDSEMEPFTLRAVVTNSTLTECSVGRLEPLAHENNRKSVRYPLSPPASIYAIEDTAFHTPQECQLMNISTGGACIVSTYAYEMGQPLRLRVELIKGGGHTSYQSQVVRITPQEGGGFAYGLLFAQLDKRKMNELQRDIDTIQAEARRRVRA